MAIDKGIPESKTCKVCGRTLPIAAFSHGRNQCIECRRSYHLARSRLPEVKARQAARDKARVRTPEQLARRRVQQLEYSKSEVRKAAAYERAHRPENMQKARDAAYAKYLTRNAEKRAARKAEKAIWEVISAQRKRERARRYRTDPVIGERMRAYQRAWKKKPGNRIKQAARMHRRRVADYFTPENITRLLGLQRNRCAICKTRLDDAWEIDHIVPIVKGGTNDPRNLQLLCVPCNRSKGKRDPIEHMQKLGLLL